MSDVCPHCGSYCTCNSIFCAPPLEEKTTEYLFDSNFSKILNSHEDTKFIQFIFNEIVARYVDEFTMEYVRKNSTSDPRITINPKKMKVTSAHFEEKYNSYMCTMVSEYSFIILAISLYYDHLVKVYDVKFEKVWLSVKLNIQDVQDILKNKLVTY